MSNCPLCGQEMKPTASTEGGRGFGSKQRAVTVELCLNPDCSRGNANLISRNTQPGAGSDDGTNPPN